MGRRGIFAGLVLAAVAVGVSPTASARDIRGDDAPPCRGAACNPSPPMVPALAAPAALDLTCGLQLTGRECRLRAAEIPACSAAANEAFALVVKEQAGARVDPKVTAANALGIAYVDRNAVAPSALWTPTFSTKKTLCGTVVAADSASGGAFQGPVNDERVRVAPSAAFQPLRTVAGGLAESAVTTPVLPSGFLPARGATYCAFGPVVSRVGPDAEGRPEIHPVQTQWWALKAGRRWLIKGSQDASQRFTASDSAAPRRCPSFICDPPPEAWRNLGAAALPHAVEIAFELDLRDTETASFNLTTLEDDNTALTSTGPDWGAGKDGGAVHDLLVDDRLVLTIDEAADAASHVDLREVCRDGALLRGYVRVAFVTGSAPVLEDGSGRQYGRKTIQVDRAGLGAAAPRAVEPQLPRAVRLGARAPRWNGSGIRDDVGVRQDLRSWRERYRLVSITNQRGEPVPFRQPEPLRALDWVDVAVLPDADLLRDQGPLTFLFAERDRTYTLTVGSAPPRPTFDVVRENGLRVADTDAGPAIVRLAGGAASAWPALSSLYDIVRYSSLDLHVRPGYVDAATPEGTDFSAPLNDAINTPPEGRAKVFGSPTPFKAAWRLKAYDAESRAEVPVRDGSPDGSATVFTEHGDPDGVTESGTLRVHFPDLQGRVVDLALVITLTDAAGYSATRELGLLSHAGWIRAAADWETLRGPLGALAGVKLDEVAREAGLLNGTPARAAMSANATPRLLFADALWTLGSRTVLAHSRLEASTLRRLIELAREYAGSAVTSPAARR